MKKILFLMCMLTACFAKSNAQLSYDIMRGSTFILMKGFTYVYDVDYYGNKYQFYVMVKNVSNDGAIDFDYKMTNANKTQGSVNIAAKAMKDAVTQFNYFAGGKVVLEDKTSVWVSKGVFKDLIEKEKATISPDGGKTMVQLNAQYVDYDFSAMNAISNQNMTDIGYVYAADSEEKYKYWIHLNSSSPLILKMDLGWTIELVRIERWD